MNPRVKHVAAAASILGFLGIVAAGCLDRPIVSRNPTTNTTFVKSVYNQQIDKLDLLFMIDNSPSMGDKQTLLSLAVPTMITRLVEPNCVDNNGIQSKPPSSAKPDGTGCPAGFKPEFPPVHDMHIGIVTSSLGGHGGDICPEPSQNEAAPGLDSHNNDKGELINRAGVPGDPTMENAMPDEASPDNFLAYFPNVGSNAGKTPPSKPVVDPATLISDFQAAVAGVHEHGCGFEAQNEAWYRFLVQPDPFEGIYKDSKGRGTFIGNGCVVGTTGQTSCVDETILQQRADFLRPDSLLAVIVVTDENEEVADPIAVGGQAGAFSDNTFPGPSGTAPEGTIQCSKLDPMNPTTTGPNDKACTSCAFAKQSGDPSYNSDCPVDGMESGAAQGYLDPSNDALNVRYFHQKMRFGVFAGYPITRYIRGLQKTTVPSTGLAFTASNNAAKNGKDSDHEHDGNGNYVGDQDANADCVNPIYAQNLPKTADKDLCHLTQGPRASQPNLVFYAAIAGVPHQLLQAKPGDPECPSATPAAQCPQKKTLTQADWKLITGADPEHYDFSGADYHMIESEQDRTANTSDPSKPVWGTDPVTMASVSNCPDTAADNCDPINGREFATNKEDLQFACIFPLVNVVNGSIQAFQKDCTQMEYKGACDCTPGGLDSVTPLCCPAGTNCSGKYGTTQYQGKAYESVRELEIAHAMSTWNANGTTLNNGIVSSLCPIQEDVGQTVQQASQDPLFGYNPAANAIIDRLKTTLSNQCIPETLTADSAGNVPCLILASLGAATPPVPGACANPGSACDPKRGLIGPDQTSPTNPNAPPPLTSAILQKYCQTQHQAFLANHGIAGSADDPDTQPTCAVNQLTQSVNANDFQNGSCSGSSELGWCYVGGPLGSPGAAAAASLGCPQGTIVFTNGEPPSGAKTNLQCLESSVNVLDGGMTVPTGGDQ